MKNILHLPILLALLPTLLVLTFLIHTTLPYDLVVSDVKKLPVGNSYAVAKWYKVDKTGLWETVRYSGEHGYGNVVRGKYVVKIEEIF